MWRCTSDPSPWDVEAGGERFKTILSSIVSLSIVSLNTGLHETLKIKQTEDIILRHRVKLRNRHRCVEYVGQIFLKQDLNQ